MLFSRSELEVIAELGNGNTRVADIAKALHISQSQIYRIAEKLDEKGILNRSEGVLVPEMKTHVNMLLKLLSKAKRLAIPLSGTGLEMFMALIERKTVKDVEKVTNLHKTTVLKKIGQGRKMSFLLIEGKTYRVNEKIWPDAKECLLELKKYEESVDKRVPVNSEIYFKSDEEIVFSNKEEIEAEKTAFSAFGNYDIKLLLTTTYYCLPKRKLSKEDVFWHALQVAQKSKEIRHLIFVALFYAKYKRGWARMKQNRLKHDILENLDKIFEGVRIPEYPTLQEIRDRADVYNIKV
jgi:DNA-binding MarR family transcriptional regulator